MRRRVVLNERAILEEMAARLDGWDNVSLSVCFEERPEGWAGALGWTQLGGVLMHAFIVVNPGHNEATTLRIIAHELKHLEQLRTMGVTRFRRRHRLSEWTKFWHTLYRLAPLEVSAIRAERRWRELRHCVWPVVRNGDLGEQALRLAQMRRWRDHGQVPVHEPHIPVKLHARYLIQNLKSGQKG